MKVLTVLFALSLSNLPPVLAQRGYEIQIQLGTSFNKGVSYYDYIMSGTKRHNFEFDQRYVSNFYTVSWRYPVNNYLEVGFYFTRSFGSTLKLFEAESIFFDSDNPNDRNQSQLFLGKSTFDSKNREIGIDVRVTIARFNKFKSYVVVNAGIQRISVTDKNSTLEVIDSDLRENFLNTYLGKENVQLIGFGLGLSRLLSNGINFKIIEVYGKGLFDNKLFLSFPVTIELKTGVSYQFNKRK